MIDSTRRINYFLYVVGAILLLGLVMVFSASFIFSKEYYGSPYRFILRQLGYVGIGTTLAFICSRVKSTVWFEYGRYLHYFIFFLILLTFIPGLGVSIKGAHRWLHLGPLRFQPSEMMKYSIILIATPFFEEFFKWDTRKRVIEIMILLFPLLLILKQPDFGTFTICFLVIAFIAFMSSFPRKFFYSFAGIGVLGVLITLFAQPYRVKRFFTFLDPWANPRSSGFQIIQSFAAFAHGAFWGRGLGNSTEKLFYLPEAHNDFIFSVIGEELGFVGVVIVVLMFLAFIYLGFLSAMQKRNRKYAIVQSAIIFTIGIQASFNMAVVLGLLPTKGLNLPFISYGGSSLIANLIGIGIFLSIERGSGELDRNGVTSSEVKTDRSIYFTS